MDNHAVNQPQQDLAHLRPHSDDEIDLGELLRNLFAQWQLIIGITVLGAIIGVAIAVLTPKQYRVELVFEKPSNASLTPLLSQSLVELNRPTLFAAFLRNLKSIDLTEEVLAASSLLVGENSQPLSPEQRFTKIVNVNNNLRISPAQYDFLPEITGAATEEINQISFSLLTTNPNEGKLILDSLIQKANQKTTADFKNDILGAQSVSVEKLTQQFEQIEATALARQRITIDTLEAALSTAESLGIEEPTTWLAWVHGTNSQPLITTPQQNTNAEAYLRGSRVLKAEIATIKNNRPILPDTAANIQGQLAALQALQIDFASVSFIAKGVEAQAPANSEKPNRPLIAIAATVLAGFFGLFVALIRLAIRKKG